MSLCHCGLQSQLYGSAETTYDVLLTYFQTGTGGIRSEGVPLVPDKQLFLANGRLGTFLSQCSVHADVPRIALFLRFFNVVPDNQKGALGVSALFEVLGAMEMASASIVPPSFRVHSNSVNYSSCQLGHARLPCPAVDRLHEMPA